MPHDRSQAGQVFSILRCTMSNVEQFVYIHMVNNQTKKALSMFL